MRFLRGAGRFPKIFAGVGPLMSYPAWYSGFMADSPTFSSPDGAADTEAGENLSSASPDTHEPHEPSRREFTRRDLVALWLYRWFRSRRARNVLVRRNHFRDDDVAEAMNLQRWVDREIDRERLFREMDLRHERLENRFRSEPLCHQLRHNFGVLRRMVGLTAAEEEVVRFFVVLQHDSDLLDGVRLLDADESESALEELAHQAVGKAGEELRQAFSGAGRLHDIGLLHHGEGRPRHFQGPRFFSNDIAQDLLRGRVSEETLLREIVQPPATPSLTYRDFPHLAPTLRILRPYLRQALRERRPGVNLFLYGPPGTGKTELSRILGREMRADLQELSSSDRRGHPVEPEERLQRVRFASRILGGRSLLVVDEAEDLFPSGHPLLFGRGPAARHKAWLHRTLEENPVPVIWISNEIGGVDPANARRFDFLLEVPVPPRTQRIRILRRACGDLLSAGVLEQLGDSEHLAPAVVERTARIIRTTRQTYTDRKDREQSFLRLVNQTLEGQKLPRLPGLAPAQDPIYDPRFVNCGEDLAALADALRDHPRANLCLYGPPGTGKTSYLHWLARKLERPIHLHRASDLLDMYVGQTEKKIARAFRRAEEDGALLLFDEVDSFLRDRTTAARSWEVTQVNELLTRMESFPGIFAAATNLREDLDAASLRRFDLKLCFDYLRPEQATALLGAHCRALGIGEPGPGEQAAVAALRTLTPGDFANVARQARFRPIPEPAAFRARLEHELTLKKDGGPGAPLGFHAA